MKRPEASEVFRRALLDAQQAEFADVPREDELDLSFSPEFEREMERLQRGTKHRTRRMVNTTAKRVLIAAVLLLLLAMTVVAAVPALREGLIRFFTHDSGVFYSFEFSEEDVAKAPENIETVYLPTYIPEGYQLTIQDITNGVVDIVYSDYDGNIIHYSQYVLWSADPVANSDANITTVLGIDSEGAVTEEFILNGYEVRAIHYDPEEAKNPTIYVWTDHEYFYMLEIQNTAEYGIDEFERIQTSLVGRPYSEFEETEMDNS